LREVVQILLRRQGHLVDIASDGLDAWEFLSGAADAYDLVITDNEMPRLCGVDLVQLLRESRFGGKIIVFSSSLSGQDSAKLHSWGVDAIIEKGGSAEPLLSAVRNALEALRVSERL
jgi:DNA-binding response OmpR family regulator